MDNTVEFCKLSKLESERFLRGKGAKDPFEAAWYEGRLALAEEILREFLPNYADQVAS